LLRAAWGAPIIARKVGEVFEADRRLTLEGLNWKLEEDRRTITVTLPTDPVLQLKLTTARVDALFKILGLLRSHMVPEIEGRFAMGQKVDAIFDPVWATEPDALAGDSLLHIRDPRYGWLHYLMPSDEARRLADLLRAQADIHAAARLPALVN
jgi:hypothetical protein